MKKHVNNYKLTPEVHGKLKDLAASLPKLQRLSKSGKPLFRSVAEFKGTKNLGDGVKYTKMVARGTEPILVNHAVELVDRYQRKGWEAVRVYVQSVMEVVAPKPEAVESVKE